MPSNVRLKASSCFFLGLMSVAVSVSAEDWNQFRGPAGNGISDSKSAPVEVSAANTVWKTTIPGTGWSSPVVSDGKIWMTTAEASKASEEQIAKKTAGVQFAQIKTVAGNVKLRAICADAETGAIVHNILLKDISDPDLINPLNSYASPTPAIEGDKVVCHFGSYGTWCLNKMTGEKIWDAKLVVDHSVGPGSSPVIAGTTVLIVCDGIDKQFVTGLDLKTGERRWTTPRPAKRSANGEFQKAYSTPLLIEVSGKTQAVIPSAQWMCAYDPASGREIWRVDCGNGFSTTPMAVYDSGLIVGSTGFMAPELVAVNPEGTGDITSTIVWRAKKGGSTMPTAVGSNGTIYSVSDQGVLALLDSKTGKLKKQIRVNGKFAASPLLVAGKLYLGSQEGILTVYDVAQLEAGNSQPKPLAVNKLDGPLMASPAMIGSDMILRTSQSLLRVR